MNLRTYNNNKNHSENIQEQLRLEYLKYKKAIERIQSQCCHDLKLTGHDSHYNYYKCSICQYELKV